MPLTGEIDAKFNDAYFKRPNNKAKTQDELLAVSKEVCVSFFLLVQMNINMSPFCFFPPIQCKTEESIGGGIARR